MEDEDLVEMFLQYHRFFLSPRIYPLGTFYSYMISKNVFRPEDQDDAESRFLDIVATKGPGGFRAFLEVLEYEYPHVYWHVANEKPRDPPHGWWPETPMSASSIRLKQKMADLISDYACHAEDKKDRIQQLQKYVLEVEEDHSKLKKDLEDVTSQKETERQLLVELNERKEDYNREEANYYKNKSQDLASEYNALLKSFQQVTEQYEEEPIYRAYYHAPPVPDEDDLYVDCSCSNKDGSPRPILPPRKVEVPRPSCKKCSLFLYKRPGNANTQSSPYSEVERQEQLTMGNMLHFESRNGIVMLSTDRLKEIIKYSTQNVLLQMPAYKEFAIMIKRAGIKFVVVLVKVEDQPETQLMRSLRANLTRHNIVTLAVPKRQLVDVDDLTKKVMSTVKQAINRPTT
ncbi:hypothetical protein NP493_489g03066 [Ridgeia piscesae]|uniref:CARD domain-containing protein n=1 Tax=Ridgeia piscesae TaxID=27915 RepID=A0AAD9NQW3_RIDPI|nr:hypothetical protein NP493_489g03066 [Ridgeia piscesae]